MKSDPSEEDYFLHLIAQLDEAEDALMDQVLDMAEWAKAKRALMRWIEKTDAEYDQMARDQEAGIEP